MNVLWGLRWLLCVGSRECVARELGKGPQLNSYLRCRFVPCTRRLRECMKLCGDDERSLWQKRQQL